MAKGRLPSLRTAVHARIQTETLSTRTGCDACTSARSPARLGDSERPTSSPPAPRLAIRRRLGPEAGCPLGTLSSRLPFKPTRSLGHKATMAVACHCTVRVGPVRQTDPPADPKPDRTGRAVQSLPWHRRAKGGGSHSAAVSGLGGVGGGLAVASVRPAKTVTRMDGEGSGRRAPRPTRRLGEGAAKR